MHVHVVCLNPVHCKCLWCNVWLFYDIFLSLYMYDHLFFFFFVVVYSALSIITLYMIGEVIHQSRG